MDFNNYEIQKALDELEIDIELTKVDEKYIKQKYHRLALNKKQLLKINLIKI